MAVGDLMRATVKGVPVVGFWTGRGIRVTDVLDAYPLDEWYGLSDHRRMGRIVGWTAIEVGGEYAVDSKTKETE